MALDAELVATVTELDPEIKVRAIRLAHRALDKAEFLMEHGDARMQAVVIREYLKIFSKHLEKTDTNSEIEKLRAALFELREAVMNHRPPELPATVEDIGDAAMEAVLVDKPPQRIVRNA